MTVQQPTISRHHLRVAAVVVEPRGAALWTYAQQLCGDRAREALEAALQALRADLEGREGAATVDDPRALLSLYVRRDVAARMPAASPECPAPSALAAMNVPRALTGEVRARLAQHASNCGSCAATTARLEAAEALLVARSAMPAPSWMYDAFVSSQPVRRAPAAVKLEPAAVPRAPRLPADPPVQPNPAPAAARPAPSPTVRRSRRRHARRLDRRRGIALGALATVALVGGVLHLAIRAREPARPPAVEARLTPMPARPVEDPELSARARASAAESRRLVTAAAAAAERTSRAAERRRARAAARRLRARRARAAAAARRAQARPPATPVPAVPQSRPARPAPARPVPSRPAPKAQPQPPRRPVTPSEGPGRRPVDPGEL